MSPLASSSRLAFLREYPFGILGAVLLLTILGAPLTSDLDRLFFYLSGPARLLPFTVMVAATATFAIWSSAKNRAITVVLVGSVAVMVGLSSLILHNSLIAAHLIVQTIFLLYVAAVIVRAVFTAPVVDGNILCGAACVYLLVGVLCGYVFCFIEFLLPGSFTITTQDLTSPHTPLIDAPGWLIYFSFTTLTTVGFGDILPSSGIARSTSVVEAVIGQIMLVVMMARLVGLHVAHSTRSGTRPVEFQTREEPPPS